jgi:hypothetical protein
MPPRQRFPRLNSRFDLKHMRDDFSQIGVKDPAVYDLAAKQNRLIITFNGKDFKKLVGKITQTGVINVSANLRYEQIDPKFTALLTKSSEKSLYGQFTDLTGETEV